ncbi:MAG: hypothetical protein VKL23_07320 [Cyanobacteriota bacterium]|jgi:hypothetical protein|nr:hypothetical protein [Cyanobacteriota bacterium]
MHDSLVEPLKGGLAAPAQQQPLPVVMTPDMREKDPCTPPLSFTIPLDGTLPAPSWLELLGQR